MCGYLGAAIHKKSFLRWGKLVTVLSRGADQDDDFRLFVAGEWSRFDGKENRSGTLIKDYLSCWRRWASQSRGAVSEIPKELEDEEIEKCRGRIVFLSHPCTWNCGFETNPFANF